MPAPIRPRECSKRKVRYSSEQAILVRNAVTLPDRENELDLAEE